MTGRGYPNFNVETICFNVAKILKYEYCVCIHHNIDVEVEELYLCCKLLLKSWIYFRFPAGAGAGWLGEGWHGRGRLLADAAIVPGARCAQSRTAGSFPAPAAGLSSPWHPRSIPVLVLSQHLPAEVSGSGRLHRLHTP